MKKNGLLEKFSTALQTMEKLMMMAKYQTVTEVLKIIQDKSEMKNMGDYHNHY